MNPTVFRIILALLAAIAFLILVEWYSAERLRSDLARAEAEHLWAAQEYETAKRDSP